MKIGTLIRNHDLEVTPERVALVARIIERDPERTSEHVAVPQDKLDAAVAALEETRSNGNQPPDVAPMVSPERSQRELDNELLAKAQRLLAKSKVPEGWSADRASLERVTKTQVSYEAHNGVRIQLPAARFTRMQNGVEPWEQPPASDEDVARAADLLGDLSFATCSICRRRLDATQEGRQKLEALAWAVVKRRKARLPTCQRENGKSDGSEEVMTIPRVHGLCVAGEEKLADALMSDQPILGALRDSATDMQEKTGASMEDVLDTLEALYGAIQREEE